jgi:hypothetical protein
MTFRRYVRVALKVASVSAALLLTILFWGVFVIWVAT